MSRVDDPTRVIAYYTLCAAGLDYVDVPGTARKQLPLYPQVSGVLIGRLAVDRRSQAQGVGSRLLSHALKTAWESTATVGASLIIVDALDDRAATFYEDRGFIRLKNMKRLIMPMRAVRHLFS